MYSHGFGTLFLAEAYGMTHRPEIREKLQKAVRLIIDSQNIEGGWRYQPVKHDADLSVTICQINALRAARNAGLFVPKETVDACIRYVKQSQNADGGFRYMLQAGPTSEFPRSAAGVVALQSAGEYDSKEVRDGIAYLRQFGHGCAGPAAATITISMVNTTRPRPCGYRAATPGASGIRPSATSCLLRQSATGFWTDEQRLQRVRHRHGADHPPDPQRLPPDLSAMNERRLRDLRDLEISAYVCPLGLVSPLVRSAGRARRLRARPILSSRLS